MPNLLSRSPRRLRRPGSARFGGVLSAVVLAAGLARAGDPFPVAASREGDRVAVRIEVPAGHLLYADSVGVEAAPPARLRPLAQPQSVQHADPFSGETVPVHTQAVVALFAVEGESGGPLTLTVRRQGCDASVCFLPLSDTLTLGPAAAPATGSMAGHAAHASAGDWSSRFTVSARAAGYLKPAALLRMLDAGRGAPPADAPLGGPAWLVLLTILLGGLALNLTPCVLPMIPVNLAIIGVGREGASRRRGLLLGGLYGLGMALAYGALGAAVVLTGATFGAINASPWFNLAVAALFVALALALFDVWALDFSRFQSALLPSRAGGALMVVALGALSAVLAGACVAPVVLSVLLLATGLYARGARSGLLLPFLLGGGMALPWPAAGAGLALLPKPGRWMQRVKAGFGVLILLAAAYYAWTGFSLARPARPAAAEPGWMTDLPEALAAAEREGKPVFLDFWATWCKNCRAMDATTFKDPAVRRRLEAFVKVKLQAEHPDRPPARDWLRQFSVKGLPAYIVLIPRLSVSAGAGQGREPAGAAATPHEQTAP